MKRFGLLKNDKMGEYEKEKGYASYKTICDLFVGNMVLCNNIVDVDDSVYYNMEIKENEEETPEIYQYYLCNISSFDKEILQKSGVILSYSDKLDCDVICVDHFGTSWDYVLTNFRLFDTYEELKKYEEGINEE